MYFEFDFDGVIDSIRHDLAQMEDNLTSKSKTDKFLRECGKVVKTAVENNLNRSEIDHVHMKDDVKSVLKTDEFGERYVQIGGGKQTAHKWHMLENGTLNHDGTVHTKATHFVEKSLEDSEEEINKIADSYIRKGVQNG